METFFTFCKRPIHKKYQNIFNAECPICKEGKSAGRTRRLFYFPHKKYFYCHNCVKSWRPLEWIKEVTNWSFSEILKKNNEKEGVIPFSMGTNHPKKPNVENADVYSILSDLPENSIDLTDPTQIEYYKDNKYVKLALQYCEQRRLFSAINTCKRFYLSLDDKVHKNRLVIPFFADNNIISYQTRALTPNQFPKYLTKFGEKELFGLQNVTSDIPYVFIFEGPIDSMFVKNGVAMASFAPTEKQVQSLNALLGYQQIWVFDNDKNNKQTSLKIQKYIASGKRLFMWPKQFSKFKDINEICCRLEMDELPWNFIVKNSAQGPEACIKQKLLRSH